MFVSTHIAHEASVSSSIHGLNEQKFTHPPLVCEMCIEKQCVRGNKKQKNNLRHSNSSYDLSHLVSLAIISSPGK